MSRLFPKTLNTRLRQKTSLVACAAFMAFTTLSSANVAAHHGEAAHYHLDQEVVVEGVIREFHLVNPHAYIYFDAKGEGGAVNQWRCELGTNLRRHGWTEETLVAGGRVRVTGNPARREDYVCKIGSIEHEDGRTLGFRGAPIEGTSTYKPEAEQLAFNPKLENTGSDSNVTAVGSTEAGSRLIVDVPTEGLFGHWKVSSGGVLGVAGMRSREANIDSDLPLPTSFMAPDYKPAGQALSDSYDESFDNPALQCSSSIFDGIFHHGNTNEFVQESDTLIRWVYGFMDLVRTIHMDQDSHPENIEPSAMGYSIGRWEGDALVVHTRGFSKQWLYDTEDHKDYVVASAQLDVVETLRYDEKNNQLVLEYTATDPLYWNAPLTGVMRLSRSDTPYQTYGCVELSGDNNRRADGSTIFD